MVIGLLLGVVLRFSGQELSEGELIWMKEDVEIVIDEDKQYNLYLILRIIDDRSILSLITRPMLLCLLFLLR